MRVIFDDAQFDFQTLRLLGSAASGDAEVGLCALAAAGRLDGQVEFEGSWRQPGPAIDSLLHRHIGGKAVLHVDLSAKAAVPDIPAVHESYAIVLPATLK
jgi:hypothetical protein